MKKLVLAEKPSVAREIARVMGCTVRGQGYLEGPEYVVTWALGHLVELAPPADYDEAWKRWSMGTLPMLPSPLKQVVIESSRDQYRVVKTLMERPDISSLVIATDAGREGELVARWIMKKAAWKGTAERLWISSQTDQAIKEGFASLKPASLYDNLYHAAESRAAADWYVGMNVTRALTCHYDAKLTAGRVQTPTLALITAREDERDAFVGQFYWTLRASFGAFGGSWIDKDGNTHITKEDDVRRLEKDLPGKEGKVESVVDEEMREQPPLAYDLTELQRDANIQLGFSAKQTLDTLQKLYETYKIVTYPRTDSRYITHDIVPTLPDRLRALSGTPLGTKAAEYLASGYRVDEDRFVKDLGVTDHHALLPTEQHVDLSVLPEEEKKLWTLIAVRFLEVLSPDYVYGRRTVRVRVGNELFQARLSTPRQKGWKAIASLAGKADGTLYDPEGLEIGLSAVKEGDAVTVGRVRSRKTATPMPERYTDASLLSAMEHAGRFVDDAEAKRHLGAGLGTPATRADLIEKLVQYHYVDRVGKEFVPTPKGREVVRLAPEQLRSPVLTGKWEERLEAIADGTEDPGRFVEDIKKNARELVEKIAGTQDSYHPAFTDAKECPFCHGPMMKVTDEMGRIHYVCQRLSCSYEEMIVRRRIPVEGPAAATASQVPAAPAKKAVIVRRAVSSASAAPGRHVLLKRKPTAAASAPPSSPVQHYTYKEVVEVVRPSKRDRSARRDFHGKDRVPANDPHISHGSFTGGASFADLIKASQERYKKKDRGRK